MNIPGVGDDSNCSKGYHRGYVEGKAEGIKLGFAEGRKYAALLSSFSFIYDISNLLDEVVLIRKTLGTLESIGDSLKQTCRDCGFLDNNNNIDVKRVNRSIQKLKTRISDLEKAATPVSGGGTSRGDMRSF